MVWVTGVALMDVAEGYVVEAVEEGGGYPVDATDADVTFGVTAGCGVCAAGGVADGCVAHDMMRSAPSPRA